MLLEMLAFLRTRTDLQHFKTSDHHPYRRNLQLNTLVRIARSTDLVS